MCHVAHSNWAMVYTIMVHKCYPLKTLINHPKQAHFHTKFLFVESLTNALRALVPLKE